jgi:putative hemolysin
VLQVYELRMTVSDSTLVDQDARFTPAPPAGFSFTYATPEQPFFMRWTIRLFEQLTGRPHLEKLYRSWVNDRCEGENGFAAAMRLLKMDLVVDSQALARAPKEGPLLIIANHPFGVIDGLTIGHIATLIRPDVKIMTHSLLCKPPEFADYLLPVDFSGTEEARTTTVNTRKSAMNWLQDGHCLVVFPSGSVATSQSPWSGKALEPAWHPFVGKLARFAHTTVLPLYFHGQNSRLFQIASHTNFTMRLSLLFRESLRRARMPLKVGVGAPIKAGELTGFASRGDVLAYLRASTLALGGEDAPPPDQEFVWPAHIKFT